MTVTMARRRTWQFPRLLLMQHIAFGSLMWAGLVLVTLMIAAGIAYFDEVTASVWEQAGSVAVWYAAGVSGYVAYQTVPMHIAHGWTRRDTAIEVVIFMVIFAAVAAMLVAVGYLIEYAVYGLTGWPREVTGEHLFSSHLDVAMIFTEYWLMALVWAPAGAFVGAAVYRYDANGWLSLIPASILIGVIGAFTQAFWGPVGYIVERLFSFEGPTLSLAIPAAIACSLIALTLTWPILRDLPVRNR